MPDGAELERQARDANSAGHRQSFAALDAKVRADPDAARRQHVESARHYVHAAQAYTQAAGERLRCAAATSSEGRTSGRERAAADYGFAASDFWYAGRAFADAYDFERAADQMVAAATTYAAAARLHEEDGGLEAASTLRVIARFRYLDAQRYCLQASQLHRRLAAAFAASGAVQAAAEERQLADDFDARAQSAAAHADAEGPKLHAAYQEAYQGRISG